MSIGEYHTGPQQFSGITRWQPNQRKTTVTKVIEYDADGRIVKETETTVTEGGDDYSYPYQPVWQPPNRPFPPDQITC